MTEKSRNEPQIEFNEKISKAKLKDKYLHYKANLTMKQPKTSNSFSNSIVKEVKQKSIFENL